ncbi:MAG TPA: DUF2723 domain-containing protein, partial [Ignavibacteria bacterium]
MNYRRLNYIVAGAVLLVSAITYLYTMQKTLSFWDCGEFIACGYTLSVPHPPGAPFWVLLGKIATMIPFGSNPAIRMNALAAISSAFTAGFLYLVIVSVIKAWKGEAKDTWDAIMVYGSAAIGALSYAFCDSAWFNANESEVYALGTMLVALCVWLLMYWWEKANEKGNERILLFIAFVIGISLGIHLLVVQVILIGGFIYYFKKYKYERKTFYIAFGLTVLAFFIVYPVIVLWYPSWLGGDLKSLKIEDNSLVETISMLAFPAMAYFSYMAYKKKKRSLSLALAAVFFVLLGYSIYTQVILRANVDNLPINENEPKNLPTLVSYLSREQYGDAPFWPRRYSQEPMHKRTWANYTSDMDFLWRYQINHMFNRYLGWQYIGRASYDQDAGIDWSKFYGVPFLIGLFGLFYHFRKDWKLGLTFLWMFALMGILTALFQRQQDPQPRERDYFYTGAFFVYSLWIGLGVMGILELIRENFQGSALKAGVVGVLAVSALLIPVNMFRTNFHYNNRNDNKHPFDYAYNLLQGLDKDAILITNGDNDTFPLWYIQAVEGYRTDVRVVNLSLLNTNWYIKEMKNSMPYGALKVPISLKDEEIDRMGPIEWGEFRNVTVVVPPEAYPDSIRAKGNTPDKLTWRMPFSLQSGNVKAVRVQDLLILDILKTNNWKRPVYFSATVTEDNYIGLDEYLVQEGMGKRIVPYKSDAPMQIRVNAEKMWANFMVTPAAYSKTPQDGYFFTGFNNPNIFFDQVHENNAQNYRSQYLYLAYEYANRNDMAKVNEVLDKMNGNFPANVIEFDYRILYDVCMLYLRAGNQAKFDEYSPQVETKAI